MDQTSNTSARQQGGYRAAEKLKRDDPDFYPRIGSKGGKETQRRYTGKTGFARDPELARRAGKKGGSISRKPRKTATEETRRELQIIADRIISLGEPDTDSPRKVIGQARKHAARELHRLGYSYRDIARALGLKSPHSIGLYVKDKSADA